MKKKRLYISISFFVIIIVALIVVFKNNTKINEVNIDDSLGGTYTYRVSLLPLEDEEGYLIDTNCHGSNSFEATIIYSSSNFPKMNHIEFDMDFSGTIYSVTPTSGWVTTYNPNGTDYSFTSNNIYETDGNTNLEVEVGKICFTLSDESSFNLQNAQASLENTNTLNVTNIAVNNSGDTSAISTVEYNSKYYYKINLTSTSVIPTDSVTLTASIPDGLIIKDTDGGTKSGRNITWNVGSMAVNAQKTYIVEVQVDSSNMHNYISTNLDESITVQISGKEPLTRISSVSIEYPKLVATMTASSDSVKRGDTYYYDVTIVNNGSKAYNVNISDVLPTGIKLVDSTSTTYTNSYATIAKNQTKNFKINVQVKDDAAVGDIENTVDISAGNYKNVSASKTVSIVDSSLDMTVTPDKSTARIGENVTWSIAVNNSGTAQSDAIQIISTLPSNLELVTATGADINGNVITWSNAALNGGASVTKTLVTKVKESASLNAELSVDFKLKENGNDKQTITKKVTVKDALLSITNTAPKSVYKPGESFNYTITVNNTGDLASRSITVEDVIDSNLEITSYGGATLSGNKVTWNVGSVEKNGTKTLTIGVKVKSSVANNTGITSTATLKEDNRTDKTSSNSITIKKPIGNLSYKYYNTDLNKELSYVTPGEEFIYQVILKNTGAVTGNNISLTSTIDNNLTIVNNDGGTTSGNTITWTISSINANATVTKNIRVKVKDTTGNGTTITNTSSASGDSMSASSNASITANIVNSDLNMTITPDKSTPRIGENVTWSIIINNTGENKSGTIEIIGTLPNNLEFVSATGATTSGNNVIWTNGSINSGTSITKTLVTKVKETASINDVLSVQYALNEVGRNSQSLTRTITVKDSIMSITNTTSKSVYKPGESFNYALTVSNKGEIASNNVVVEDIIDSNLQIISYEGATISGNKVTWNAGSVAKNETKSLTIGVKVKNSVESNTSVVGTATLKEDNKDNIIASNSVTIKKPIGNLSYKYYNLDMNNELSHVAPKDEFIYQVALKNTGEVTGNNITLTATIDSNLTIIDNASGTTSGNTITWTISSINSNATVTKNIRLKVKDATSDGTSVTNILSASGDSISVSNNSSINVMVVAPNLNMAITPDKNTARIGENITWSIVINNIGENKSEAFDITSTLPSNLELVTATGATVNGSKVTWDNSALNSGASVTKTLVTKVKTTANINDVISVPFVLKESGNNEQTITKSVTVKDSIMTITNITSKSIYKPGEEFNYTVSVKNTGDVTSRSVIVEDIIDTRLQIVSAGNATINGNKVTWNVGNVTQNETKQLEIRVKVKDVANNTSLTSTASLKETNREDIIASNSVTIKKPSGLLTNKYYNNDMTKELSTVSPGEEFIYQITLKNTGEVTGSNIVLTSTIDNNLTIIDNAGGTTSGNKINWTIPNIDSNEIITKNIKVKVKDSIVNGTNIINNVIASGDSINVNGSSNINVIDGDIYVVQTPSKEKIKAGDDITYTIKVGNRGHEAINNIVIIDTLPPEFELISSYYPEDLVTINSNIKNIVIPVLEPSAEVTIQFVGKISSNVSENQSIVNRLQLNYEDVTVDNTNTTTVVDSNVSISILPSLIKVLNKEIFNYTITLKNNGTGVANNIKVTDNIPNGLEIISCDNCTKNDNSLIWQINTLGVNETKTFVISARVNNGQVGMKYTNNLVVLEEGKSEKIASSIIEITKYKINVSQKSSVTKAKNNDEFKYTITVKNDGNQIVNAKLVDYIDPNIEVINVIDALYANDTLVWNIQLGPNEEKKIVVDVRVKKDAGLKEATNKVVVLIDNEEYATDSNKIALDVDTVNPYTGSTINYIVIILGIIVACSILIITNKKKRIYKI